MVKSEVRLSKVVKIGLHGCPIPMDFLQANDIVRGCKLAQGAQFTRQKTAVNGD